MSWEWSARRSSSAGAGARRRGLRSAVMVVAAAAGLLLSGCAAGMISQTAQQVPAIDGANGDAGRMALRNVLLATPDAANYPQGSDVPVHLVLVNNGTTEDSLTGVSSPVAGSVKLSGEVKVPAGSSVTLGGEGQATAVLTGINRALCFGQSFPLTFSFAQAGQLTLNVPIQIPDQRTGERSTIAIQPAHPTPLWETGHAEAAPEAPAESSAAGGSAAPGSACTAAPAPSAG